MSEKKIFGMKLRRFRADVKHNLAWQFTQRNNMGYCCR
jgi:hypothetical protein